MFFGLLAIDFGRFFIYNEFEWYYYVIPLIAVVGYMVYRGINNIARVGEIVINKKVEEPNQLICCQPLLTSGFTPSLNKGKNVPASELAKDSNL